MKIHYLKADIDLKIKILMGTFYFAFAWDIVLKFTLGLKFRF